MNLPPVISAALRGPPPLSRLSAFSGRADRRKRFGFLLGRVLATRSLIGFAGERSGRLTREAGFALAFLAVWMLAILAPAHQVSRLGGEMRAAGVMGLSGWTLCLPGGAPEEEEGAAPILCPAQSLAHVLDAPPGISGVRLLLPRRLSLSLPSLARPACRRTRRGRKQPRAPPLRA